MVDLIAEGGAEYLVCASTPIESIDEIKSSIDVLNKTGEAAKKAGIKFCYHNHDAEFKPVDGKTAYELFLTETDPANVKMELDVAWSIKGGADPVALFKKYPGRFPLWHVKDLDQAREKIMAVGEGTIDYAPVFKAADTAGLQYFFVEHDFPQDAMKSIRTSLATLKKLS